MKVVSTEALTKLIQLVKSAFVKVEDVVETSEVTLADVALSGDYDDLINKPTIPTATSDLTNDSGYITNSALSGYATQVWVGQQGYITGITSSDVTTALGYTPYNSTNPSGYITSSALTPYVLSEDLATVATSGSYNDLSNKPTIPAAQVNSDWNATSGVAQILNKPTIPTVNNASLIIQKNGTNVATFTANASSNVTANISVPNTVSSVSSSSTNADAVGAKLFYDTVGDIETLINAL